jgi:hypothetical protein
MLISKIVLSGALAAAGLVCVLAVAADPPSSALWTLNSTTEIGGHAATVLGHPRVIDSPVGKALEFNGSSDAIEVGVNPLAGAEQYTYEAVFRPDGGEEAQRWFHIEENPATGDNADSRMLFEIRVVGNQWCLDAFVKSGAASKALMFRDKLHPLGKWYATAAVYDGKEFRSYVNGVEQGAGPVHFDPLGPGKISLGVRLNKVFWFKGAIAKARFTRRALQPSEFLKVPDQS